MNIIELYSVLFSGLLAFGPGMRLIFQSSRVSRSLITFFGRFVRYPLVLQGGYWTSVTRLELLVFFIFLGCNIFVLVFRVLDTRDFEMRAAVISVINMTPLFLGGKPNPLIDLVSIPLPVYHVVHHWIGRVAILEGLLHAALSIGRFGNSQANVSGAIVATSFLTITLASVWVVRRYSYRLFLHIHTGAVLASLAGMIWHVIAQPRIASRIPIFVGGGLWVARFIFWLFRIYLAIPGAIRSRRQEKGAIYVHVSCSRPVRVFPGCYFFLFLPGRLFRHDLTNSVPMLVMWYSSASTTANNKEIAFLVSDRSRIFNLPRLDVGHSLLLDGPYGRNLELWDYETVILAAKGIGIAGILSSALCLLDRRNQDSEAKKNKQFGGQPFRDLTRKVAIVWALEDNAQEDWAASAFSVLQGLDSEQTFLLVWCIYPSEKKNAPPFQMKDHWQCFYSQKDREGKYLNSLVLQDTRSPGKSVVVACGDPDFTHTARQTVTKHTRGDSPIHFLESEYRPSTHGKHRQVSGLRLQEQGDMEKGGKSLERRADNMSRPGNKTERALA